MQILIFILKVIWWGERYIYDKQYRIKIDRIYTPYPRTSAREKNIRKSYRKVKLRSGTGVCAHCKEKKVKENIIVDHIIPLWAGGSIERKNLQLLCITCNELKNKKELFDRYNR